jgi:hypothetical protein
VLQFADETHPLFYQQREKLLRALAASPSLRLATQRLGHSGTPAADCGGRQVLRGMDRTLLTTRAVPAGVTDRCRS